MTSRIDAARSTLVLLLGSALLSSSGCGPYSTTSGRLDPALRRVAVPYLENQSAEPNIEIELTDAIVRALQDDNTLKVTDEPHADTLLSGKVVRYKLKEAFARPDLQVDEYQIQILVELSLVKRVTGEPIFAKRRLSGTGNFLVSDSGGESLARQQAASEIVRQVLALVVEDW